MLMMSDARGEWKPMLSGIYLYVNNVDVTYKRALQAGATSMMEPADQLYGDRNAGIKDPVVNHWWIATHKEDLSSEEIRKRAEKYMTKQNGYMNQDTSKISFNQDSVPLVTEAEWADNTKKCDGNRPANVQILLAKTDSCR